MGTSDHQAVIAFDVTRLFLGPLSRSPRGIDRVDLALAQHLFAAERGPNVGVLPTPWGVRFYDSARVRRGIAFVSDLWAEGPEGEQDRRWPPLAAWLRSDAADVGAARTDAARTDTARSGAATTTDWGLAAKARRMLGELSATGFAFGRSARARLPAGATYLNVGQLGLAVPAFHRWQERRPDVTVVTMLHDTIPIDHPEQVSASSVRNHRQMVRTAARHAHALIVTTEHARATVAAEMALCGAPALPTLVRRLPLPASFAVPRASDPMLAGTRYFVSCGTIEPRKNHALLLDVWRRLADRLGPAAPQLVIVGSLGFQSDAILRPLAEESRLQAQVTQGRRAVDARAGPADARRRGGAVSLARRGFRPAAVRGQRARPADDRVGHPLAPRDRGRRHHAARSRRYRGLDRGHLGGAGGRRAAHPGVRSRHRRGGVLPRRR